MNGLSLHTGSSTATIDAVRQTLTPPATGTWHPIAHADLYDRVRGTMESNGLRVVNEAHGLWHNGDRYFGLMEVRNGDNADDFGLVIGLRNSHDQTFPAALALGSRVFVCDNLAFSGEVKLSRKHTTHIWRDLPGLVDRAVGQLHDLRGLQSRRIEAYKNTTLMGDADAHDLIIRAVDARVIPGARILDVVNEWRKPQYEEFRVRTIWSLQNAFTEVLKGALHLLPSRTQALHGLLDSHVGLLGMSASAAETPVEMAV